MNRIVFSIVICGSVFSTNLQANKFRISYFSSQGKSLNPGGPFSTLDSSGVAFESFSSKKWGFGLGGYMNALKIKAMENGNSNNFTGATLGATGHVFWSFFSTGMRLGAGSLNLKLNRISPRRKIWSSTFFDYGLFSRIHIGDLFGFGFSALHDLRTLTYTNRSPIPGVIYQPRNTLFSSLGLSVDYTFDITRHRSSHFRSHSKISPNAARLIWEALHLISHFAR